MKKILLKKETTCYSEGVNNDRRIFKQYPQDVLQDPSSTFRMTGLVCATALAVCLLVSTSVLALGGGGHGHKSSTYKGGVDAIGVHFNSSATQDSDQSQETCPPQKQCGDYCCQGDNVCKQETQECCSESLNYCCPAGQSAYKHPGHGGPGCCNGELFCGVHDANGSCISVTDCCPPDKTVYGSLGTRKW